MELIPPGLAFSLSHCFLLQNPPKVHEFPKSALDHGFHLGGLPRSRILPKSSCTSAKSSQSPRHVLEISHGHVGFERIFKIIKDN